MRCCKVYILLFTCLSFRMISHAQPPNVNWYSVNEGLSQSMVTCFYKDTKGLMWIGTGDGLNSFDGRNFVKYRKNLPNSLGLENNTIRQVAEDEQGTLWVVTDLAVYTFDPAKGLFHEELNATNGIGGWKILGFRNGIVNIYSSGHGLFDYNSKTRSANTAGLAYDSLLSAHEVLPFANNYILIAGPYGISRARYKDNKLESVERLVRGHSYAVRRVGNRAIASCNDMLVSIDSNFECTQIPLPGMEVIYSILPYDEQQLLAGTKKSLFIVNIVTGKTSKLQIRNREQLVKMLWKNGPDIWIGTDGAGFGIWSPYRNKFAHFDLKNGIENNPNSVFGIMTTEKHVWHYVHERGIVITDYTGRLVTELRGPGSCFTESFLSMKRFGNSLYIGSCCGLYSVDGKSFAIKKLTYYNDTVLDIVKTGNRLYTFGWNIKEYSFGDNKLSFIRDYRHNSKNFTRIKSVVEDGDKIWGTDGFLVFSLDKVRQELREYRFPANFPKILSLYISHGNDIVLATSNGIYVYSGLETQNTEGLHYLNGEMIYGILKAKNGKLWCTGNSGIFVLDGNYQINSHFTVADGLQSLEFNSRAYDRTDNGFLVFGGINGSNVLNENDLRINTSAPLIKINQVAVNEEEVAEGFYTSTLKLDYSDNVFSAKVTALEYAIPERVKYQFKLEGWDKNWSIPTSAGYVRYAGTRSGNYRLLAKACNGDGIWSEPLLLFRVEVIPPWWATWWFRIAAGTILIFIGVLVIRYIARRKLKKQLEALEKQQMLEAERSRISRDMHDDLGVELTKISLLSKSILRKENDQAGDIRKIADTSDILIQNMREIIWALNTNNDTIGVTTAYLREYALNMAEGHALRLSFEARIQDEDMVLGANTRRNLFLICKEALNNIIKHSKAAEISITLSAGPRNVTLTIMDNGEGFAPGEHKTNGNGLLNMRSRAREINASMELSSVAGEGTKLQFDISI